MINRDVTERKRVEEALNESERKYHALFSEMYSGSALHELVHDDTGTPVDYVTLEVNKAYEVLLQVDKSAVIGRKASEILPQGELEKWLGIFAPVALTGKSTHYEMYSPLNDKYFEGVAYCPEKGKSAVIFSEVSERKQTEDTIRALLRRHEALLAAVPEIVMEVDKQKVYTWANQAGFEFFGADVIGKEAAFYFEGE